MSEMVYSIGLMSGTSMDGIDAAIIKTDGYNTEDTGIFHSAKYEEDLHKRLRDVALKDPVAKIDLLRVERDFTIAHAAAVNELLRKSKLKKSDISLIGFHGQTLLHAPNEKITWQMGNPGLLAELTGINVIADFRRRDVAAGGQGAPLVPLFHMALVRNIKEPVCILNLGGVGNLTYIEKTGAGDNDVKIMGFDTGPGNALIDNWIYHHTGEYFDEDGKIAARGKINPELLSEFLSDPFFAKTPPKSLDRDHFSHILLSRFPEDSIYAPRRRASDAPEPVKVDIPLSLEDGAATLVAFTAQSVGKAVEYLPSLPKRWFVCGGGRHNPEIMKGLQEVLKAKVAKIEDIGFNGDSLEAQAFAYLAVRSYKGLNLSLPETTGIKRLVTGGAFYRA